MQQSQKQTTAEDEDGTAGGGERGPKKVVEATEMVCLGPQLRACAKIHQSVHLNLRGWHTSYRWEE